MSLYNDISPQTLMIMGVVVTILFLVVAFVLFRDTNILIESRRNQEQRIRRLRLGSMLGRLHISMNKYFRRSSDMDQERHIWICEHCPDPEKCERMFKGEDIDPKTFCPNINELEKIKGSGAKV